MIRFGVRDLIRRVPGFALAGVLAAGACGFGQTPGDGSLPRLAKKDGRYALIVDGAPYLMLGAQINNSSAWPEMLPKVWPAIEALHANTVEMPIYWEQFEPRPGVYDESVLRVLLNEARAHHVRLVLLWFGAWKNGSGHYTPEWIKNNVALYPHVVNKDGRKMDSLSPIAPATLEADRKAFTELMRHLKAADPQHTVLMVQVENESGAYGCVRDYGVAAQKMFEGPVPEALLKAMSKQPGTWAQVFGDDADEVFQAWSVARYIDQVAAAGKAVYPLPMYANVALRDPFHPGKPGSYASGGPTDNVIPVWKAAAPSIDVLAPDIYMVEYANYNKVLDLYHRPDNAMFVPETGNRPEYARYFFAVLGHQGIGFSPFGMDYTGYVNDPMGASRVNDELLDPFALNYRIAGPMMRELARLSFEGRLQGVSEDTAVHEQTMTFGGWKAVVSYGLPQFGSGKGAVGNPTPTGGALIGQMGPNEFLVSAVHARVEFSSAEGKPRQYLRVEEGTYEKGVWHFLRIWNGDQTDYGLNFTSAPQVLRVTLSTY